MSEQLDEFFKEQDTTLIFDVSNLAHNNLHAVIYTAPTDNGKFDLWKYAFVNSLFSHISNFNPSRVILAEDAHNNWRYDIYPQYKCERKLKKDSSDIQYDKFYEVFNEILIDIKSTFTNIFSIKEDRCEADDVISVLSREIKDDKIIIISSDRDFNQLLVDNRRILQFKPITKTYVESINPNKELQIKILTGDRGDSIPPIRAKIGPKTACKILESGLEEFLATDPILQSNYDRNKRLIDLKEIPEDISSVIINSFENYPIDELDAEKVFKFFNKHRLRKVMDNWNIIGDKLKRLK